MFIPNILFAQVGAWDDAPKKLVDLYKSAYKKARNNDIQKAINDLTIAIEIDSNYRAAYSFRGQLYRRINENSNALLDYSKALQISDYNYFTTIKDIGYIRFDLKDYDESFKIFNDLEKRGVDIGVKYMKAISAYYLEDYEMAIEGFNNSILFDHQEGNWLGEEGETKACYYRANSKLKLKKHEEAIKDYNIVISRNKSPFYDISHYERGLAKKSLNIPYVTDFYKSCELGYSIACFTDSSKKDVIKLPKPATVLRIPLKKLKKKITYNSKNDSYKFKNLILKTDDQEDGWLSIIIKASSISNIHKVVRITINNFCVLPILNIEYKDGKGINHEIWNDESKGYWDSFESDHSISTILLDFNEIEYIEIYEDECGVEPIDLVFECFPIE